MSFTTADLYDAHGDALDVLEIPLLDLGGRPRFSGRIATLKTYEDNTRVRQRLSEPGEGRVLVIDGAGSLRYALVGDQLGRLAVENGWSGIVVFGAVRDAAVLRTLDLGVRALGTCPRKTDKRDEGLAEVVVRFGGASFRPDAHIYVDEDGVVVASQNLLLG